MSMSVSFGVVLVSAELSCEFPTDRDADEHPHPRLLREQRLDALPARGLVGLGDGGAYLGAVGVAEPAALLQRVGQDPLQLRGELRQRPLGAGEALWIGERPDGRVHLLVAEHQYALLRVNTGRTRPRRLPARPPPTAAPMLALSSASESRTSTIATTYTPRSSFSRSSPRRAAMRSSTSQAHRRPSAAPLPPNAKKRRVSSTNSGGVSAYATSAIPAAPDST